MAQSVKHPNLAFSSGHDLRAVRSSLTSGFALGVECAWDSLSPSPSASPPPPKKKKELPCDPVILLLGYIPKRIENRDLKRYCTLKCP